MNIFVINPGSTSTKFALYNGNEQVWTRTVNHAMHELSGFTDVNEQLQYRTEVMHRIINEAPIPDTFDAVIARGGLLRPTPGGIYDIDEAIKHDLINATQKHACNLGALMAAELAGSHGCPAFIADPEVVDELIDESRLTGIPSIERHSIFHALNTKAVARRYADSIGRPYEELNLIMVHLGGGISVGAHLHGKVADVNNALNGDGPFSPERAGTIPADQLAELCFSGRYTLNEVKRMLNGAGGLAAHLGITDVAEIVKRAESGETRYKKVLDAMLYNVAKEIGARAVTLRGDVDAIILTGGIAHSSYCVDAITSWVKFIAPIVVRAGEDELASLAENALRALKGTQKVMKYDPDRSHSM